MTIEESAAAYIADAARRQAVRAAWLADELQTLPALARILVGVDELLDPPSRNTNR